MQASDFMNDEAGTQELCRHVAHWLFGSTRNLPRPDQPSDQAGSQHCGALSEDQIKIRHLQYQTLLPA